MPRRIRGANIRRRHTFLREWREHAFPARSLDDVAEQFDMSAAQLSRIERGLSPYTQDFLELAAGAYGTDPASLLMRRPGRDEIWSIWQQAGTGQRQTIIEIAKTILKTGT